MKRAMFVAAAALLAAACQPMPPESGRSEFAEAAVQTPTAEAAACAARGGKMLPQGRMQSLQCVVTYADAGRRCTDGDQCEGDCRIGEDSAGGFPAAGAPAVGQCQRSSSRFGCSARVEDGKAEPALCID